MKLSAFQSAQLDAEKVKLRKQVQELQAQLQKILLEKDQISKGFDFQKDVMSAKLVVPPWHPLSKKPSKGKAVVSAFLSDTHYDEWIDAAQVAFMNEYNRKIAEKRTQNFFDNVVTLSKHYLSGMTYDGLVLSLGGDILSGAIHEELVETNEAPILESVLHWTEQLISGIEFISQHFNHVQIPCVVGNHGRRSKKPRSKGRVQDNFDWLIYMMLQRHFKGNDKISFLISPSADQRYEVYDTRFLLTHGDQFRGGSGISGLMAPLLIGDSRKRKRDAAVGQGFCCFCGDTSVLTRRGMIRIADVRVGDLVWTHLQRWRRVCDVSCQEADTVVIKGHGHPGLITTAEHPFEAYDVPRPGFGRLPNPVNSDWVKASNMVEKWWSSPATFPVTEALTEENYRIGYEGLGPQTKRIEISSALMNFVGQWLGNGCVGHGKHNKSTITLCGHMRKKEHMLAISTSAGLRPSIIPGMTKKNVCVIQCYSSALARWLTHHFGAYAYGKTLPAWVFFMPEEYRRQLLLGYQFADGHQQYEHLNDSKTVSRNLGFALKILAQTLSLHTTMSHKDASEQFFRSTNKISKTREQWRLRTITKYKRWGGGKYWDGRYMGRVKSVIPGEKQLVYNLSVDEDESYVADGVIVRSGVGRQIISESLTLFSRPRIGTSWTYAKTIENDTHWMSPYRIGCLPSMPCESYKTEKNVAAAASQPAEIPLAVLYSSLGIKDSGNGINISCVAGTIGRDWWSLSYVNLSCRN